MAERLLSVLESCAALPRPLTLTELVELTGLAKTTVHRMSRKLAQLGLLERSNDGYSVGTKMFALASSSPAIHELRATAIPHLVELQRLTGASNLAILTEGRALIVDGLFTAESRTAPLVGAALPLHCTAVGKAILAKLDPARRDELLGRRLLPAETARTIVQPGLLRRNLDQAAAAGVAFSRGEFRLDTVSVAAAFRVRGDVLAAIGCVGSWNNSSMSHAARRVAEAATALEVSLARARSLQSA